MILQYSILFLLLVNYCVADNPCIYYFPQGVINLTTIGLVNSQPRFKDVRIIIPSEQYKYSYNPCYSFTERGCQNVAACQS
ncbi:unnamed protein product [Didymodactylos carnosus]|uniref:Uncharacterized protein n=1 Tax=Didymodactylos carnosus TaxID=1234261 RepID=A0A815B7N1_9BILA|nr:unnamed protein product [Didymodactylos carnosus]CAF1535810.1 unnamed protein product [Didymodactylos carnosus]CAF4047756.1 unnamed protein product [Didymodactylos carnosus]CAF4323509.1 unnamed protein product [Didymodactylos carnosus]